MCDYCDCRSHPEIAALSADHELLLHWLSDLQRAVENEDRGSATELIGRLRDLLHPHAAREERGIFTELRDADVDDRYIAMFERDHDEVHRLLETYDSDWRVVARELITVLTAHIAREESDLFPAAHQLLTPSQWESVAAAIPVSMPK